MEGKKIEDDGGQNNDTSDCCPICLAPVLHESYLNQCFHKFCYNCILHWTKVVARKHSGESYSVKCPLCKTENTTIIHDYDGSSFQQHHVNEDAQHSFFFSRTHKYRLQCYYTEAGIAFDSFNVRGYWKSNKHLQPNRFLYAWLRRELQALIQEEDVDIIVHHIHGMIDSFRRNEQKYSKKSPEAKQQDFHGLVAQAARPFLTGRTDRFVSELELFLASGLTMEAYDKVYTQRLGWKIFDEEEFHDPTTPVVVPYLSIFDEDCDGIDKS